jgi:long-subunit fatty acid transport protein
MKKVFALLFVAGMFTLASCESKKTEEAVDSTAAVVDSAATMVDSAAAVVDSTATAVVDSVAK